MRVPQAASADYKLRGTDLGVDVTTSTSTITVTLPDARTVRREWAFRVAKVDSGSGKVSIATVSSQTVSGQATATLEIRRQYQVLYFTSDGSNWVVSGFGGNALVSADHLALDTSVDSKQVHINSRNFVQTSGDSIGFQSKPAQAATSTGTVQGGQISPRVNDTFGLGTIIGLHVDSYLKGTTGNLSGDVRGLNLELVTDDAGARNITGNVSFIRMRGAFSAGTVTGKISAIRIEKLETQTGSKQFDAVLELPSTNSDVWGVKGSDYTPAQPRAKIKVLINGTAYWLIGYATEPT